MKNNKRRFWAWALLALLCLLVFWPMFRNGFVWDDSVFIRDNGAIRGLWPPARFLDAPPGFNQRPLVLLSFALDYRAHGLNPFGYHLTNLILHLLCVLAVVLLGQRLLQDRTAGLLAGALFAIHPGHAEAVISFLGRSDLLAAAFLLWGFLAYLHYVGTQGWKSRALYGMSLVTFALASLSKDTAVIFPFLLLLWEGSQGKLTSTNLGRTLMRWAPFLAVLILYAFFRKTMVGGETNPVRWWGGGPWKTVLLVWGAYWEYLRLSILPVVLSPWYELEQIRGLAWIEALGVITEVASLLTFVWLSRKSPRLMVLLGWFLLGLSPVLLAWLLIGLGSRIWGVLPGTMLAERWLYFPSAAISLGGAWGWLALYRKLPSLRWALVGILIVVGLFFGLRSSAWAGVWKDQQALGQAILARFPESYLGHLVYGQGLIESGRTDEGLKHYQEAVAQRPDLAWVRYNYAVALQDVGRAPEAIQQYREVIRAQPRNASAHNNLGSLLYQQGLLTEAEAAFREAVRLDPDHVSAHMNLGNVLDDLGQPAQAEVEYRKAILLAPEFAGTHYNLAVSLIRQGRKEEAVEALNAFLDLGGEPRSEAEALIRKLKEK